MYFNKDIFNQVLCNCSSRFRLHFHVVGKAYPKTFGFSPQWPFWAEPGLKSISQSVTMENTTSFHAMHLALQSYGEVDMRTFFQVIQDYPLVTTNCSDIISKPLQDRVEVDFLVCCKQRFALKSKEEGRAVVLRALKLLQSFKVSGDLYVRNWSYVANWRLERRCILHDGSVLCYEGGPYLEVEWKGYFSISQGTTTALQHVPQFLYRFWPYGQGIPSLHQTNITVGKSRNNCTTASFCAKVRQ